MYTLTGESFMTVRDYSQGPANAIMTTRVALVAQA